MSAVSLGLVLVVTDGNLLVPGPLPKIDFTTCQVCFGPGFLFKRWSTLKILSLFTSLLALFLRYDQLIDDGIELPEIVILPAYANLPGHLLMRIFQKTPEGCRKVVFCTNLCETSLTVDGVR